MEKKKRKKQLTTINATSYIYANYTYKRRLINFYIYSSIDSDNVGNKVKKPVGAIKKEERK